MSEHTPGPWSYSARLSASENHHGFRIFGPDRWSLADVQPVDSDGIEGESNARLIAAAPALLDALERLCEHSSVSDGDVPCGLYDAARAAIAAARGKP
jgi:hypothetical protein